MVMKQPQGESEWRHVCSNTSACGYVDYYNPKASADYMTHGMYRRVGCGFVNYFNSKASAERISLAVHHPMLQLERLVPL